MLGQARKIIGSVLGLLFLAIGVIPLLNQFKVISFMLPAITMMVLWILGVIGGVVLLYDGFKEGTEFGLAKGLMIPTLIVAVAVLAVSLIPLLNTFGVLSFALPPIGQTIIDVLFSVAGLLLIVDAFVMPW